MEKSFDPYHVWLGIPPQEQPPNYYRLLGIVALEADPLVIESAADRQMAHVKTFQTGPHTRDSQRLLNEIAAAKVCLLHPEKRIAYEAQIRAALQPPPADTAQSAGSTTARPFVPGPAFKPAPALNTPIRIPAAAAPENRTASFPVELQTGPRTKNRKTAKSDSNLIMIAVAAAVLLFALVVWRLNRPDDSLPEGKPIAGATPSVASKNDNGANQAAAGGGSNINDSSLEVIPPAVQANSRVTPEPALPQPGPGTASATAAASGSKTEPAITSPGPPSASPATIPAAATEPVPKPIQPAAAPVKVEAAEESWIDLLAWTEGVDWASRGIDWNANLTAPPTRDGITLKPLQCNRYPLAAFIDGDYDLQLEFTRDQGRETVSIFFPIGDHNLHLELGAHGNSIAGVHWIDGKSGWDNATRRRPFAVRNGERHRVNIRVRREGETASFNIDYDNEPDAFHWQGLYSTLMNVADGAWHNNTLCHLAVGSWECTTTFHKARIRMVSGDIHRDWITDADRASNLKEGYVRLIGEKKTAPSVGWGTFVINQMPLECWAPGEFEQRYPLITREFAVCQDFYGAHAPSRLKCPIPKGAKSFTAVGYNDVSRTTRFEVLVDGEVKYASGMTHLAPVKLDLPPKASLLELIVNEAGDAGADQSYWCYPKFHSLPLSSVTEKMMDARGSLLKFTIGSAAVGWDNLTHNQPIASFPLVPVHYRNMQPCDEFICAVATSSVTYAVPPGMNRFTAIGYCVLSKSVRFEVLADGARIFQSPQMGIIPIDVRLPRGTKSIELKVDNLGDTASDFSMWCYPRLHTK